MSHLVYCSMHATAKGGEGCREHYKIPPPLPLYTLRGIEPRLAQYGWRRTPRENVSPQGGEKEIEAEFDDVVKKQKLFIRRKVLYN